MKTYDFTANGKGVARSPRRRSPDYRQPNAKFSYDQVVMIRALRVLGHASLPELSEMFGTSEARLSEICHGHTYKNAGGPISGKYEIWAKKIKATPEKKAEVFELREHGHTWQAIADKTSISKALVGKILHGRILSFT